MGKMKTAAAVVFAAALAGGFFSSIVIPEKEFSDTENRSLETKPELSAADILSGDYQEHYEKYLNDQMFLRDNWVSLAVSMERLFGKRDINGVYIGKNGYLLEKYEKSDFDAAQTAENVDILAAFLNDAAQLYGTGNVSCMMLPAKADALPDFLPGYAVVYDKSSMTDALRSRLADPDILLDAGEELRKHQDEYIYYRTDHHWTTLGAYYAYCAWAEHTGRQAGKPADYDRETVFTDFYGTTYNKVHIKVPADQVELFHHKAQEGVRIVEDDGEAEADSFYFMDAAVEGFNRYNVFFSKNTAKIEVMTKAGTGRNLLLVKDSFANCFVPFLAGDYDKIIMIDCRYGKESVRDLMAQHDEITDVLVMYNTVKFMQDTNLDALDQRSQTMEEFDLDDFLGDLDE